MNVLTDPMFPIKRQSGKTELSNFANLADDSDPAIELVYPRADLNAAGMELLVGMFALVLAPDSKNTWLDLQEDNPSVSDLENRILLYVPYFNLDGNGPRFMQDYDPNISMSVDNAPSTLLIDYPGENTIKNNHCHFVKTCNQQIELMSPTMAAIGIYTRQSFAPSWGTGYRVGQRGGGPLSTVVVPDNATLFQVILANLPILSAQTIYNLKNDIPKILPWLAPTIQSAGNQIPSLSQVDELQTFFATPNRIRLDFKSISSRCVISGELCDYGVVSFTKENYGVNYSSLPYRHPMTPYYQSVGKTPTTLPVHPSLDKIGWQNYKGWIYCNDASNNILTYRELAENNTVRVRARGYDVTNAKVNGFVDHEVPLHCFNNAQDRTTFDTIVNALIEATSVAGSYLRMTLRNCHSTTTYDAENAFWEETKPFFFDILNQLWAEIASGQTPTLVGNSWSSSIRKVSYSLLDQHTPFDVMNLNTKTACKIAEQRRFFGAFFAGKSKQGKQFQALLTGI